MGEDVGLYGGAYGATRDLFKEFGEWRVIDTPISEATIGGAAVGAAMAGMRPIAEIMYVDFTPLAMDQIANQGAKNRYMFGGKTTVPMVIRTEGGAGRAIAAHHSQSLESLWTHFPGIYVVMPSTPYDAKGLLKAAIRDDNPVMFIEHKMLYKEKGFVPEEEYIIPFGVADIKRPGKDVTLVTYSRMVYRALEAAETLAKEGLDVEVVDLRTLKPLDIDTIVTSVKKTGRLVCVSEAYENTGFINEVMMQVNEQAFDYLDAPMVRVASANVPVPRAEILEDGAIPNVGADHGGLPKGGELMAEEFFIPKLGQTVEEVTLVKWLVEDGAKVSQGQAVMEVETDKAVFPVEANARGVIHIGPYQEGQVLPVLTVVAVIGKPEDKFEVKGRPLALPDLPEAAAGLRRSRSRLRPLCRRARAGGEKLFASPRARKLAAEKNVDLAAVPPTGYGGVRVAERDVLAYLAQAPKATPVAQRMAAEAGVDLRSVAGTGPGGRIVKEDIARAVAARNRIPVASCLKSEVLERIPLKGVRAIIAERMAASVHTTARVTLVMEADATEFVAARTRIKEKVEQEWGFAPGYNDLLARIVAAACAASRT